MGVPYAYPGTGDRAGTVCCWYRRRDTWAARTVAAPRRRRCTTAACQLGSRRRFCPKISEAQDAAGTRDADESNVFLWPVSQDLLHFAAACDREIHAARLAVNMAELEAGFPDGRVVNDRQKASRVGHYSPIEECFVVVEQIDQVNVAIEVRVLVAEFHHHPA
jgi:hypothetical protein